LAIIMIADYVEKIEVALFVVPVSADRREARARLGPGVRARAFAAWRRRYRIFLMNVESVEQAKTTIEALPLVTGGYATYDFMQVGPLAPLGLLLQGK